MAIKLPSPAKINLFLHVIGQRPDGYHRIQTVFQFIDLADEIEFALNKHNEININTLSDIPPEQNLAYLAAQLIKNKTQCNLGIDIRINKKIPLGAGLGGGSSNAATTLIALNYLWDLKLTQHELQQLGIMLGADVPIFLHGETAFAEGIGEQLQPLDIPEEWILLLFPNCKVETAKIFSDPELTRSTPEITITEFLANGGHNDCEPIARKHFPEIVRALNCLNQFTNARMTGTGSSVFATFKHKNTAIEVARKIPASINGIIVKGLNKSPLQSTINRLIGVSPSGKAQGFDPCIPRFES
jgi:4-diphosphocytidyl-2-C-methyl-D-erythritol kinase